MICTEQERAALMAHVRRYGHARDRDAHEREMGDYEASERWNKSAREYLDAIRAMLAPDDAVVIPRELAKRVSKDFSAYCKYLGHPTADADALRAVLRREATRDE